LSLAVPMCCVAMLAVAQGASAIGTGAIEGKVTNASGVPVDGVLATFYNAGTDAGAGTALTNSSGEYTLAGLTEGSYKVKFSEEPKYLTQYYNDEFSLSSADPVPVTAGNTTKNIDAKLQEPGTISGRVTSAATGSGLGDVSISLEKIGGTESFNRFTTTEADGSYTIAGLPPGEYSVSFSSTEGSYIGQGTTTTVTEGAIDTVNVALKEGGKISGRVTDSVAHNGLAKIVVSAVSANPASEGFSSGYAETNANGEYTVTGLSNGSYKVEFAWEFTEAEFKACEHAAQCPPKYITQYFNDQPSAATANAVGASEGSTTSGINAAMVPAVPVNTALPAVSGTPTVGSLLSCSSGSWTGESVGTLAAGWPLTSPFAYQWLRDGGAIAGATSPAYLVQAGDVGHSLACEVGATNYAGHASAKSNPIAVTLPAVTVSGAKVVVSAGAARVPIACANAACAGTIELTGQIAVKGKGKKKAKKKTVVLGKGSYSLAAGKSATIVVRLAAAGKSALAKAKGHKLSGKAGITVTGGLTVTKPVVLSEAAKKKGKKK
jgi:hypothetical protein